MIIFARTTIFSFNLLKRFPKMPGLSATDLQILQEGIESGESLLSGLKEEIKSLVSIVVQKQEAKQIEELKEENKKLQNELTVVKKELVKLQIANGVAQIPVPDNDTDMEELPSFKEEQLDHDYSLNMGDSSESKNIVSSESVCNETKSAKASKPKKSSGPPATPEAPVDVSRLDIRVGKVLHAQVHPDADGLYIEQIDVGEQVSRTVVSGLVKHVPLAELDRRMVVVLCNLKPQKMRGIVSEAMVLCASTPEAVELLTPPPHAVAGDNVTVPGYPRNPDLPFMNPKKKIFEKLAEDLKVNSKKQACYKDIPWEVEGKGGFVTVQAMSGCYIR